MALHDFRAVAHRSDVLEKNGSHNQVRTRSRRRRTPNNAKTAQNHANQRHSTPGDARERQTTPNNATRGHPRGRTREISDALPVAPRLCFFAEPAALSGCGRRHRRTARCCTDPPETSAAVRGGRDEGIGASSGPPGPAKPTCARSNYGRLRKNGAPIRCADASRGVTSRASPERSLRSCSCA